MIVIEVALLYEVMALISKTDTTLFEYTFDPKKVHTVHIV